MKDFFNSTGFRAVLYGILLLAVLLAVFMGGVMVGTRKADYSYRYGANYERNFGRFRPGPGMMNFFRDDFIGGHGTIGKIVRIALPQVVVSGPNEPEKIIQIGDDSQIRRFGDTLKPADLKLGDNVVVIGVPDSRGVIDARLIRVLPPPPSQATSRQNE